MPRCASTSAASAQIKDRDEIVGNETRVKVVKNKVAPPFKQVEFDIMYGEGISKVGELVDLGVKAGIVEKSGAWFSYDGERIGQGRENTKAFLKQHPKIADQVEKAIRQNAGLIVDKMLQAEPEGEEGTDDGEDPEGFAGEPEAETVAKKGACASAEAGASGSGGAARAHRIVRLPAGRARPCPQRLRAVAPRGGGFVDSGQARG